MSHDRNCAKEAAVNVGVDARAPCLLGDNRASLRGGGDNCAGGRGAGHSSVSLMGSPSVPGRAFHNKKEEGVHKQ